MMSAYQLAQINIGTVKAPLDSPLMADFVNNLDRINALAEGSPGFVWRLMTPAGDATALRPMGDDVIINMSVWESVEHLSDYVFRSLHKEIMRRRREWFERMSEPYTVLWWVKRGHEPTIAEAIGRLEQLRAKGPTADAFTFKVRFPPPDAVERDEPLLSGDECPAL